MRMPSFVSTAILLDRKKRKKRRDLILPGKVRIDGFEKRNPQAAFVDLGIWERRKKKSVGGQEAVVGHVALDCVLGASIDLCCVWV